jgi:uncharacterized protein (UPF0212 family)
MVVLLWRESWLKPLSTNDIGSDTCPSCNEALEDHDIVTSCEFCEIGIMHNHCANDHSLKKHDAEIQRKIEFHKDRKLHDYQ